jgi:hypothetical protein
MQEIIFKCPINSLSFGNVSLNLMREMFKRGMTVAHFPIGNLDASVFNNIDKDFQEWLQASVNNRFKIINKDIPTLQLWHINGSENRITKDHYLLTFYELDSPTDIEKNLVNIHDEVLFSSSHAERSFKSVGCRNTSSVPMGFDPDFHETGKEYLKDKIHFGLMGKFEKRKHTAKLLRLWAKKYGNNYNYQLSCCINNSFMKPEQLNSLIGEALEGERYGNINFLPFLKTNAEMNELLNAIDIDLTGLSGAEGWNLPSFNATALGKWSIVLNHTSHKDWANESNSILIEPSGKQDSHDGMFFHKGADFNQGNINTFNDDEVISKMEEAEKKCKQENKEGLKLQDLFSYSKTLDSIMSRISK